ncbi:MAG: electron transfer flavoprotein subunit alpha/FixB family protein [Deltaproteobacteria bacterium]|nr:MAG: electron transfer flavoprotein subunit alpha/FixB family protein [Deltaproteobacteria bacterium]
MSTVLFVVETSAGGASTASLHGISCAAQVAKAHGAELVLLVLGADDTAAKAVAAAGYGAAKVLAGTDPALGTFTAEAYGDAIAHVAKATGAIAIGATATSSARDALPRTAALLSAPLVSEVVEVKGAGLLRRPIAAGRALVDTKLETTPYVFTVRASEFAAAAESGAIPVEAADVGDPQTRGAEVLGLERTESSRPPLTEARIIVSGGRGMGSGENFKYLEELADLLGAAVGASRAATDAGMVPADLQVGQTGKVVAPDLYIAVGISGAIQHLAGMKGSKVIVAINKDPEAPIFQVADYGLVAKWEDTLPRLTELVRERKSASA